MSMVTTKVKAHPKITQEYTYEWKEKINNHIKKKNMLLLKQKPLFWCCFSS
jgi:hypothetical protein